MGMRGFEGQGCILADDMGLGSNTLLVCCALDTSCYDDLHAIGKTLMSITILWTLLNQVMLYMYTDDGVCVV